MESGSRREEFQRNPRLEELLAMLSEAIAPGGDALAARSEGPRLPVALVVGCARSGTTLMLQWLASGGAFAYPSNLLSRFYRAPAVGALVQRLLFEREFDFKGELSLADAAGPLTFSSELGKTRGPLAPHEFWYFWRRFFPFGECPRLGPEGQAASEPERFRRELGALEDVLEKPLAMKAMIACWDTPFVAQALPTGIFIDVIRDPVENMRSLLSARRRFFGTEERWYSFHPPEHAALAGLSPEEQVAGQVRFLREALDRDLATLPATRVLRVPYERFCQDPASTWSELGELCAAQGLSLPDRHPGPKTFEPPQKPADPEEDRRLWEAWTRIQALETQ